MLSKVNNQAKRKSSFNMSQDYEAGSLSCMSNMNQSVGGIYSKKIDHMRGGRAIS
jgi:hypothetical protein